MIVTLTGQNSFMLSAELNKFVNSFLNEHSDMGLERLDGQDAEYDKIRESLESMPFLSARKLVVLRAPSGNKLFAENAEKLIQNLPDTTDLIIVEPKLDKRLAYYKLLKKQTQFMEFGELEPPALAKWLVGEATLRGGALTLADANLLVGRVGANQQMLSNDLDKLIQYKPKVDKESILLLTELTTHKQNF